MKKLLLIAILSVFCAGCFALKLGIDDLREEPVPKTSPIIVEPIELPQPAE